MSLLRVLLFFFSPLSFVAVYFVSDGFVFFHCFDNGALAHWLSSPACMIVLLVRGRKRREMALPGQSRAYILHASLYDASQRRVLQSFSCFFLQRGFCFINMHVHLYSSVSTL